MVAWLRNIIVRIIPTPRPHGNPDIEPSDNYRKKGHYDECRNAHPENDLAGLKRVVIRNERQELGNYEHGTIHYHAQRKRHDTDAGELTVEQDLETQDRLCRKNLAGEQQGEPDYRDAGKADDEA